MHRITRPASMRQGFPNPVRRDLLKLGGLAALAHTGLAGCLGGGADAPVALTYGETIADARAAILKAMADTQTPSVSVALVDRERTLWSEAFGLIDKASGIPATNDTLFCIGSCSKVIAAVAVMILVDRGRVGLDEPLVRYVPAFRMASPEYTRITVRMLLSHASGFPGTDWRVVFLSGPHPGLVAQQTLATLAVSRLKHAPGEMATYCNDGFTMVEPLVREVTGLAYTEFVAAEILAPLGMRLSRFALGAFADGSYAPGYAGDVKQPQEYNDTYASGGLFTTPSEMGRLARMLLNRGLLDGRRVLAAESVAEMGRGQSAGQSLLPVDRCDDFGLGWDSVREDALALAGVRAWQKNGGTLTYSTDFFVAPDEGLAVTITGTSGSYGSRALAERILLHALRESGRIAAIPAPQAPVTAPMAAVSGGQLAGAEGFYAARVGLQRVRAEPDGSLSVEKYAGEQWQQPPLAGLRLRADGSFASDASPDSAFRVALLDGRRSLIRYRRHGMGLMLYPEYAGQSLPPRAALSPAWTTRLGRRWLTVNAFPDSYLLAIGGPVLSLAALPELPGYLFLSAISNNVMDQALDASASDDIASMCLKIPSDAGRDLTDLVAELRFGEDWLRSGSAWFRPLETVPALGSTVTIGADGYAEWRRLARPGVLAVAGASAWKLYRPDLTPEPLYDGGAGAVSAPAGAYVLAFGAPGAGITFTLSA